MIKLINDDSKNILKKLKDNSIDCVITDCPYKIIAGGVSMGNDGICVADTGNQSKKWLKKK